MADDSQLIKTPDLGKILDVYNSQTGTLNTLWNIYIAIALAMLGFIYKDAEMRETWRVKIGFSVGFLIFSLANREAILRTQRILFAIYNYLRAAPVGEDASFRQILLAHEVSNPTRLGRGHLIFTSLVFLAMWLPELSVLARTIFGGS